MDKGSEKLPTHPVRIVQIGRAVPEGLEAHSLPEKMETRLDLDAILKNRKIKKLMSKQDQLAVLAAYEATLGWDSELSRYSDQIGIYLTVGILPFEETHLVSLHELSTRDGQFEMELFSTQGSASVNPLMTFQCLPNMPVFHISCQLGLHGPYFVTYPGPAQWFQSLDRAVCDLHSGRVKYALVGAVADQRNFLVRHHFKRLYYKDLDHLIDCACMFLITLEERQKPLAWIRNYRLSYNPRDPFAEENRSAQERLGLEVNAGPVDPSLTLSLEIERGLSGTQCFDFKTRDSFQAWIELEAA